MIYVLDTETGYDKATNTAWVWSWGRLSIDGDYVDGDGTDFTKMLKSFADGDEIWIHNQSFDGEFIIWALHEDGFKLCQETPEKDRLFKAFCVHEDSGGILKIVVDYRFNRFTFRDSWRLFRRPLKDLPELYGGEEQKQRMDDGYVNRPKRHVKTADESYYQYMDCEILRKALVWIREFGGKGNTVGSISYNEFKKTLISSPFVPLTREQRFLLRSLYHGGISWVRKPNLHVKRVNGVVYDENSMYPDKLRNYELPVRIKRYGMGKPPVYCITLPIAYHVIAIGLKLKEDGFPLLITPFTGNARTDIPAFDGWLFSLEFYEVRKNYDFERMDVIEWYEFEPERIGVDFVDKWYGFKLAKPEWREYSKLILNNTTGKIGENSDHERYIRSFSNGDLVSRHVIEVGEPNKWNFMPCVAYITMLSRIDLLNAVRLSGIENLFYTDTDSIHTTGTLPDEMVDKTRLGAWKPELSFNEARYIKAKTYWERNDAKTVIKSAGLNASATLGRYKELENGEKVLFDTGETISPKNLKKGNLFYTNHLQRCVGGAYIARTPKEV